jgi:putative Mg2+ transporter-C (MgtC) family protein
MLSALLSASTVGVGTIVGASTVPTLSHGEVLVRLVVAAGLGGAIGIERELRERHAGLRTHLLVSVGAALFTLVSAYGFHEFLVNGGSLVRTDPTRIAAQIVSGIGFLGAGAIIRQGLSVRGLTTAASLWLVAAVGMASGAGYYVAALIGTAAALITLGPLRVLVFRMLLRFRDQTGRLFVQLPAGASPGPLIAELERLGTRVDRLELAHEGDRRTVEADLDLPRGAELPRIVAAVAELEGVLEVRWEE